MSLIQDFKEGCSKLGGTFHAVPDYGAASSEYEAGVASVKPKHASAYCELEEDVDMVLEERENRPDSLWVDTGYPSYEGAPEIHMAVEEISSGKKGMAIVSDREQEDYVLLEGTDGKPHATEIRMNKKRPTSLEEI